MKKGKLDISEKYAIQHLISLGKNYKEIANELDRSENSIKNYIVNELDSIIEHVVTAKVNSEEAAQVIADSDLQHDSRVSKTKIDINPSLRQDAFKLLFEAGLTKRDANELLLKAEKKIVRHPNSAQELYTYCLSLISSFEKMGKETNGGEGGVTIMTEAASSTWDEKKKKLIKGTKSRTSKGSVFNPKNNKMRDA